MQGTTGISAVTHNGYCHECSEGRVGQNKDGFALYVLDGIPSHWFCRYCGSSEVTIIDDSPVGLGLATAGRS
jgi:hypothetical protein